MPENQSPETYVGLNEISRRLGYCRETLAAKIRRAALMPRGFLVTGSKEPSPIFLETDLPTIRRTLISVETKSPK